MSFHYIAMSGLPGLGELSSNIQNDESKVRMRELSSRSAKYAVE